MEKQDCYIFVGSYAEENEESLHLLKFNSEEGKLTRLNGVAGVANPSFLTLDTTGARLFAVSETDEGTIVSYAFDRKNGEIKEINRQPTEGAAPCYVSLDETGKWLFAVNYLGGSVCMYPIGENGTIEPMADHIQHNGHSIHPDRQEASHPHSIAPVPGSSFVLVPDLGTDRVYVYRNDMDKHKLKRHGEIKSAAGSGPRHVAFHPNKSIVYVVHELNATISAYSYDRKTGEFLMIQSVSTLPDGFDGPNTAADLHVDPSGRYLYGSNRGHDSIVTFKISEKGKLECLGFTSTLGKTPRNFTVTPDGKFLLAANQDSDSIVVLEIGNDGLPLATGETMKVKKPVCLKVVEV